MKRLRSWLHDDPERWLNNNAGIGMLLFFAASWFAPHPWDLRFEGAALLCTGVFWGTFFLGLLG